MEWPIESSPSAQASYKGGITAPYFSAAPNWTYDGKLRIPA